MAQDNLTVVLEHQSLLVSDGDKIARLEKETRSMHQQLQERIDEHRTIAFLTCPSQCFCWDTQQYLMEEPWKTLEDE
jgi:hypothetical protein